MIKHRLTIKEIMKKFKIPKTFCELEIFVDSNVKILYDIKEETNK